MQRHQRGGARRVDGDRGSFEAQGVRDPAGDDTARGARPEVSVDPFGHGTHARRVIVVHHPGEHSRAAAPQRQRIDPGALERLPGRLQQQSLLRVHRQRLVRRDLERFGVEVTGGVQEPALAGVAGTGPLHLGVVQRLDVPATVGGEAGDAVPARRRQFPQLVGGPYVAGVPAAHRHDRDRLAVPLLDGTQPLAGLVQFGGDPPEIFAELVFVRHQRVTCRTCCR